MKDITYRDSSGRFVLTGKQWTAIKADCKRSFDTSPQNFEILWKSYKELLRTGLRKPENSSDLWSTLSSIYDYLVKIGHIKE